MAINFLMWIRKREIGNEVSLTHILSREIHELEETCYDHVKLHEIRVKLHEKVASSSFLSKLLYLIISEVEALFAIPQAAGKKTTSRAVTSDSHRILTSEDVLNEKRAKEAEKERKEKVRIEKMKMKKEKQGCATHKR